MYSTSDITGAIILNQVDKASIGKWNEAKINAEKTNNDTFSVIGLAVAFYTKLASDAGVNTGSLSASETTILNASLVWYIAAEFKKRDIEDKTKELCSDEDYRYQANLYKRACDRLKEVSASMASLAGFCKFSETLELNADDFSISGSLVECGEVIDLE